MWYKFANNLVNLDAYKRIYLYEIEEDEKFYICGYSDSSHAAGYEERLAKFDTLEEARAEIKKISALLTSGNELVEKMNKIFSEMRRKDF